MKVKLSRQERVDLKALSVCSDVWGVVWLGAHLGILLATGAWVTLAHGTGWLFPALVVHGVVLVFLFAPLHETIHRTAYRSRRLNDLVAHALGFLIVLPAGYFRAFHNEHHRFTQVVGRDPELATKEIGGLGGYLFHVSGLSYWWAAIGLLLAHASGRVPEPFVRRQERRRIIRESRIHLSLYVVLAAASLWWQSTVLLYVWVLPAFLGQPFLRLFLLAEHKMLPTTADLLQNSRTTLTNPVVRFLAWNMSYHVEHHAFPAVPFHALPRAHGLLRERAAILSTGYLAFHLDYVRSLIRGDKQASRNPTANFD